MIKETRTYRKERECNMRIGIFTDSYLPDINGVVTSVVTLKKALEQLGHTVFIISNHQGSKVIMDDKEDLAFAGR